MLGMSGSLWTRIGQDAVATALALLMLLDAGTAALQPRAHGRDLSQPVELADGGGQVGQRLDLAVRQRGVSESNLDEVGAIWPSNIVLLRCCSA